jgi:hypothetical protein
MFCEYGPWSHTYKTSCDSLTLILKVRVPYIENKPYKVLSFINRQKFQKNSKKFKRHFVNMDPGVILTKHIMII